MSRKKEYGDFQTPLALAHRVASLVNELFGTPELVIEPTVGLGAFIRASVERWGNEPEYEGYEINKEYVDLARRNLGRFNGKVFHRDFFAEDWVGNLNHPGKGRVLVIGNPPWVTNSDLGQLGSENLPKKSNVLGLRGIDALTGKSNFDIAEWMLVRLMEGLPSNGAIAMLCKTMTARKVLRHFWKTGGGREGTRLFRIDAMAEFNVSVDACLLFSTGKHTSNRIATVYSDLDTASETEKFGFLDGGLVSDIDAFEAHRNLDGGTPAYSWRSGVKHDSAKIMEFIRDDDNLVNGHGETVRIEDDYVFPLLKSSDLGSGRIAVRKAVLVTQKHIGDDTTEIKHRAPRTWAYLMRHADALDRRKSSIYTGRPRFSVFGVGSYSFAPWKVAISGLYKKIRFSVVGMCDERPVMVDDTCYFVPCRSKNEASLLAELLSSRTAMAFLNSLVFTDSKRPVTIDVLRRLSFSELARDLKMFGEYQQFENEPADGQLSLFR